MLIVRAAVAQQPVNVRVLPLFEGQEIVLNSAMKDSSGQTIEFSALRFYISNFTIQTVQGEGLMSNEDYFLIDLEYPESLILFKSPDRILSIDFLLGTDSITNVSGILEGPLDPINGMYWAWNSGYINFKVEGKSSLAESQGNLFEFHIGGYLPPYQTVRAISLSPRPSLEEVVIELHLDRWFKNIDLTTTNSVMIPGEKAAKMADQLQQIITVGTDEK